MVSSFWYAAISFYADELRVPRRPALKELVGVSYKLPAAMCDKASVYVLLGTGSHLLRSSTLARGKYPSQLWFADQQL